MKDYPRDKMSSRPYGRLVVHCIKSTDHYKGHNNHTEWMFGLVVQELILNTHLKSDGIGCRFQWMDEFIHSFS